MRPIFIFLLLFGASAVAQEIDPFAEPVLEPAQSETAVQVPEETPEVPPIENLQNEIDSDSSVENDPLVQEEFDSKHHRICKNPKAPKMSQEELDALSEEEFQKLCGDPEDAQELDGIAIDQANATEDANLLLPKNAFNESEEDINDQNAQENSIGPEISAESNDSHAELQPETPDLATLPQSDTDTEVTPDDNPMGTTADAADNPFDAENQSENAANESQQPRNPINLGLKADTMGGANSEEMTDAALAADAAALSENTNQGTSLVNLREATQTGTGLSDSNSNTNTTPYNQQTSNTSLENTSSELNNVSQRLKNIKNRTSQTTTTGTHHIRSSVGSGSDDLFQNTTGYHNSRYPRSSMHSSTSSHSSSGHSSSSGTSSSTSSSRTSSSRTSSQSSGSSRVSSDSSNMGGSSGSKTSSSSGSSSSKSGGKSSTSKKSTSNSNMGGDKSKTNSGSSSKPNSSSRTSNSHNSSSLGGGSSGSFVPIVWDEFVFEQTQTLGDDFDTLNDPEAKMILERIFNMNDDGSDLDFKF